MNKFINIGLMIIFLMGMVHTVNAQETEAKVAITLERTVCFGFCPVYTITILDDGTVIYNGENHVEVMGEQRSQIDPKTVEMMIDMFETMGYFEWEVIPEPESAAGDLPTVITSVTRNGETHQIARYTGDTAPLALPFLEVWIDHMTNSQLWTGVQPDISGILNGMNTPLVTLERRECFGTCPVYTLALFEDGTAIYTGIAHVDRLGVYVFEVEASSVASVAQLAQILGYFSWQDSYQERIKTDQATVVTSVRWEDDFKQITRYDGDPNAPLGLIWVEASIDALNPQ